MFDKHTGVREMTLSEPLGALFTVRCPACRHSGVFVPVPNMRDVTGRTAGNTSTRAGLVLFGQRTCPNPACKCHVFFTRVDGAAASLQLFPPETLDFDASDIPPAIASAFEEAIVCHASRCYVAAAIMVRKTLEELCLEKKATGKSLMDRVQALGTRIIVPPELIAGADNLRLLGNDAAHVESQTFNSVGEQEVAAGIVLTRELLKATYQMGAIVAMLNALKK